MTTYEPRSGYRFGVSGDGGEAGGAVSGREQDHAASWWPASCELPPWLVTILESKDGRSVSVAVSGGLRHRGVSSARNCWSNGSKGGVSERGGAGFVVNCDGRDRWLGVELGVDVLLAIHRVAYSGEKGHSGGESMQRTHVGRCGITRIEVVVLVVACLAVLCLLLPITGGGHREGARRTACTNNLRRLGWNMIRAEEHQGFIPGWRNASVYKEDAPGLNSVSWPVILLPFIEEMKLYDTWRSGQPDSSYLRDLICPSGELEMLEKPTLSYAGNVGSGSNTRRWDGVMLDTTDDTTGRVRFDEISAADGTSMTLLLAERCGAGDTWNEHPVHQYWWDRRGLTVIDDTGRFFENLAEYRALAPSPRPGFGITGKPSTRMKVINNTTENAAPGFWSQPSSKHSGGVLVVFCDGHTSFVSEKIPASVYAQLLSSAHTKASDVSRIDWGADSHPVLKESDYRH